MKIDHSYFFCVKGEFEAEGLSREDVAAEALYAARNGLDYLVKISGAEAKSDINYLADLGVTSIVCPMIESKFAMSKYMEMIEGKGFEHIGVTIETIDAVANIDSILEAGKRLTEVTIGRTDLTASWGGEGVESEKTMEMVKLVIRAAKRNQLKVTMGGSVSRKTREYLIADSELVSQLSYVETRKAVMPIDKFMAEAGLSNAMKLEEVLLRRRAKAGDRLLPEIGKRLEILSRRS